MKAKWLWRRAGSFAVGAAVVVGLLFGGALAASVQTGVASPGASAVQASTGAAGQVPVQTLAQAGKGVQPTPGPREGIKVHGHWIIEVRNRDGSLAVRREFENALSNRLVLAAFLGRERTVGLWRVMLLGNGTPCSSAGTGAKCTLVEPSDPAPSPPGTEYLKSLSVRVNAVDGSLVLAGAATVSYPGDIQFVKTLQQPCDSNVAPRDCLLVTQWGVPEFSNAKLDKPVPVVAGQIIQITVTFSFT